MCENKMIEMENENKLLYDRNEEERRKCQVLSKVNEGLKRKCDEKEKNIRDLKNNEMSTEKSLNFFREEYMNFKNLWLKLKRDLNKKIIKYKSLEKKNSILEKKNKKLSKELNDIKVIMFETEEHLRKEIKELNEKLEDSKKKIHIYQNDIKNRCVRIDLNISNEELSERKRFEQQINYFKQENKRLTEEVQQLKNINTRISETLEQLQKQIQKKSEGLTQEKLKSRTLQIRNQILKQEKSKLSHQFKSIQNLKNSEQKTSISII